MSVSCSTSRSANSKQNESRLARNMDRSIMPRNLQDAPVERGRKSRPSKNSWQTRRLRTTAKKQAHRKAQAEIAQIKHRRVVRQFCWRSSSHSHGLWIYRPWWHSDWFDHWWGTRKEASREAAWSWRRTNCNQSHRNRATIPNVQVFCSCFCCLAVVSWNSQYECVANFTIFGDTPRAIRGIFTYFFVINYLLPVTIISVLYIITARKLWFYEAPGEGLNQNWQRQQQKRKVVRMLIVVFAAFALCWLPDQVFQLYLVVPVVSAACYWFGYNNSAINPWLYISLNRKMYNAFSQMTGNKIQLAKCCLKTEKEEMTPRVKARHKAHGYKKK